jgi:hypothetical protein
MAVFCNVASRNLDETNRRFRGVYYLHYQGDESSPIIRDSGGRTPLKRRSTSTRLHGALSQKAVIFTLPDVRTLNLTRVNVVLGEQKIGNRWVRCIFFIVDAK